MVLQNISNFGMRDMEKVINAFSKERFDLVLLSIPPINKGGNSLLASTEDINNELEHYLEQSKKYRKGETERIIYQK